MPDDLEDVINQGMDELEKRRLQRLADITEGDVEVDPELLDIGDEVAEEVVSEFRKFAGDKRHGLALVENRGKGRLGAHGSKFSVEEQRAAAQKAMDIVLEQLISPKRAYEIVGAEIGAAGETVAGWARARNLVPDPQNAKSSGSRRLQAWDVLRREQLFDELLDVASMLTTRMKVWIQYNPNDPDPNTLPPPDDWNAANELKTIAVAAAVAHDKRTGIEDLKTARGLRDIDSEELQGELSAGKARLIEMGVSDAREVQELVDDRDTADRGGHPPEGGEARAEAGAATKVVGNAEEAEGAEEASAPGDAEATGAGVLEPRDEERGGGDPGGSDSRPGGGQ